MVADVVVRAIGPERGRVEADVEHVADVVAANLVGQGVPCPPISGSGTVGPGFGPRSVRSGSPRCRVPVHTFVTPDRGVT